MNLEQLVKETIAKVIAEKKGKDLTGDGKIDSADYLKARSIAIEKAKNKDIDEARFEKGEDVGGKGFEFKKIAKQAAKQYGSKEAGQRVAGAILKKVLNKEGEDHEVAMAQSSLDAIIRNAMELKAKIGDQEIDIPAWIQDHITNSENYIEQASQGYHEYENGDHEEMNEEYNFEQSAIESASGDKISHTEEDDYGRTIYWSTKNPNVNYFVGQGGEFEGKIYLYNGETGERYPIGDLKHYGDGQNHSADDDMHEAQESNDSKIENIKNKLSSLGVKYELGGKHQPFKTIYKPINKSDEWYNKFDSIIDLYNLKDAVKTSSNEAFIPKSSFDDYSVGDNVTVKGKKAKITNMKMDTESGERRARVKFEDGSTEEVNINSLNESTELEEFMIRRWQHYAGIK